MPLAYAVGRRAVLLGSTIIMILAAGVAAGAQNFEWHLAARMVLGLAAGQSEALVPMITQVRHHRPLIPNPVRCLATAVKLVTSGILTSFLMKIFRKSSSCTNEAEDS